MPRAPQEAWSHPGVVVLSLKSLSLAQILFFVVCFLLLSVIAFGLPLSLLSSEMRSRLLAQTRFLVELIKRLKPDLPRCHVIGTRCCLVLTKYGLGVVIH